MSKLLFLHLALFAVVSGKALADDEWSSTETRAQWLDQLGSEAVGEDRPVVLFNRAGAIAGLSGKFIIASKKPASVRDWVHAHRLMFGLTPAESLELDKITPFFEAEPDGTENVLNVQSGAVYWFSVIAQDTRADAGAFKVIVDLRNGVIVRGVYSAHQPTVEGYGYATAEFTESKAWDVVEAYLGAPVEYRSSAQRSWTSVSWLLNRAPARKELLWILSAQTAGGDVESFVVHPNQGVIHHGFGKASLGALIPELHRGYGSAGQIYWDSMSSAGGCTSLGPNCTNPAFSDSQFSRAEVPLLLEMWRNLSLQNYSGTYFDWPWTEPGRAPLKATQELSPIGSAQKLTVVLAHTGLECNPASPPCSNYTSIWMGPGDVFVDLYGHEFGHSFVKDLKATSHSPTVPSGALTEAMADYFGIVQEDFRLKLADPNPTALRTDFKISSVSAGLTINWAAAGCVPAFISSHRGALGRGWYEAWRRIYPTPHARRDLLFRAWQASILQAYSYTTDSFPTALDMAAAQLSMASDPLTTSLPYPNAVLAAEVISAGAPGCW